MRSTHRSKQRSKQTLRQTSRKIIRVALRNFSFLRVLLGLSAMVVAVAGWGSWSMYRFYREEFPDVSVLKNQFPVVHYRGPRQPFEVQIVRGRPAGWTSLSEVSRVAMGAILVSEDWAFFQHHGYDAKQIREAVKESWEEGRLTRGASTITQQVVKNVFLEKDKTLWRKLKELWLATRLEESVGKRRIMEIYLNIAEWGEGVFGIRSAASRYFGKSPAELTPKEGAFLAMLLPSPKRYSQSFRARQLTGYARSTIRSVLLKMQQANFITEEQRAQELVVPLSFENVEKQDASLGADTDPAEDSDLEPQLDLEAESDEPTEGVTPVPASGGSAAPPVSQDTL